MSDSLCAATCSDLNFVVPTPGRELVLSARFVVSVAGVGPATGGRWIGVPVSVGSATTRLRRPDGVVMRLPNDEVGLLASDFYVQAWRAGLRPDPERPEWEWLTWTVAEHVAFDERRTPSAEGPLVIVPCGRGKKSSTSPAGELYTGSYHRLCLRAAGALTDPSRIRILSGKHGLLELDCVVEPYEMRITDPGAVTIADVVDQAGRGGVADESEVIVLAGRDYTRIACAVWPHAVTPLAGAGGIGEQQHRLSCIAAGFALSNL